MVLLAVLAAVPAPLEVSRVVQRPPVEVFKTFTTRDGLVRFLAPDVRFSLTADGPFEALFVPEAPAGQKGGEGCVVKSWVDGRSFTFTWNFPPSIPTLRDANARTEVEVTFAAQGKDTKVTLTQRGWKEGADWAAGRAHFERAWSIVLARLARVMAGGSIDWKHAWRPVTVNELSFLQGAWRSTGDTEITEESWSFDGPSAGMWARERRAGSPLADFTEVGELEAAGDEVFLNVRMLGPKLSNHPKDHARFVLEEVDDQSARFVETKKSGLVLTYSRKSDELHLELAFPKGTEQRVLKLVR